MTDRQQPCFILASIPYQNITVHGLACLRTGVCIFPVRSLHQGLGKTLLMVLFQPMVDEQEKRNISSIVSVYIVKYRTEGKCILCRSSCWISLWVLFSLRVFFPSRF